MVGVQALFDGFIDVVVPTFLERLKQIIVAPIEYPEMIWILTPMVVTLFLMTLYFGRYKREELGWNTAVGNSLVLLFVSLDLLQKAYPEANPLRALLVFLRTLSDTGLSADLLPGVVAGMILLYSLFLLTADFHHWLPKKLAFFVSSSLPINILAYFGIIFVYGATAGSPLPLDGYTFFAFLALFVLLYYLLSLIQLVEKDRDSLFEDPKMPKPVSPPDTTEFIDDSRNIYKEGEQ